MCNDKILKKILTHSRNACYEQHTSVTLVPKTDQQSAPQRRSEMAGSRDGTIEGPMNLRRRRFLPLLWCVGPVALSCLFVSAESLAQTGVNLQIATELLAPDDISEATGFRDFLMIFLIHGENSATTAVFGPVKKGHEKVKERSSIERWRFGNERAIGRPR
jgi:hypothetical protein